MLKKIKPLGMLKAKVFISICTLCQQICVCLFCFSSCFTSNIHWRKTIYESNKLFKRIITL